MNSNHFTLRTSTRIVALAATLSVAASAQTLVRSVTGPAANAQYGKACIRVADQNNDGFDDLLVGAPGFSSQRGAVYCLSGAYLAFGTGTQTLWSVAPTANPGDLFGYAIANVGDVTSDGVDDFLVGQPGYDSGMTQDAGAVRLLSGASHGVVSLIYGPEQGCMFGSAVAGCGDANGDGFSEAAVGAPGPNSGSSYGFVLNGGSLVASNAAATSFDLWNYPLSGSQQMGASVASGFDLDGDGAPDVAFGAPTFQAGGGAVAVFRVATGAVVRSYFSSDPGDHLGASVDAAHDYDGDGVVDIVVGAPNSPHGTGSEVGRAVVLSGAKLVAQTPPYEIYNFYAGPFGSPFLFTQHLGAAVRACGDLNNDGVGDILIGAPDYYASFAQPGKGLVTVYSGASGTQLCGYLVGATQDRLGGSFAGAIDDLDGDGFAEFVVAGPLSDAGGTDSGVVKCYRLFPVAPATYCTGKVNSLGCTPAIAFSGTPSANPTAPFLINATNFLNQKNGLLFYSHAPTSVSFQGGFKCVANPTVRTPPQNSGGSSSGSSCTGTYSFDFNAWIATGFDPSLAAGSEIYAQYWSRDPASPSHTSLSNALRFLVHP